MSCLVNKIISSLGYDCISFLTSRLALLIAWFVCWSSFDRKYVPLFTLFGDAMNCKLRNRNNRWWSLSSWVSRQYLTKLNADFPGVWQNNAEELRAERLRRATERLRNPVVFNKDSAVRKTQLKSFSQYVESRPGGGTLQHKHTSTQTQCMHCLPKEVCLHTETLDSHTAINCWERPQTFSGAVTRLLKRLQGFTCSE